MILTCSVCVCVCVWVCVGVCGCVCYFWTVCPFTPPTAQPKVNVEKVAPTHKVNLYIFLNLSLNGILHFKRAFE